MKLKGIQHQPFCFRYNSCNEIVMGNNSKITLFPQKKAKNNHQNELKSLVEEVKNLVSLVASSTTSATIVVPQHIDLEHKTKMQKINQNTTKDSSKFFARILPNLTSDMCLEMNLLYKGFVFFALSFTIIKWCLYNKKM